MQFDEEMFALEAQLADLRPAECVDFGVSLQDKTQKKRFHSCVLQSMTTVL